MHQQSARKKLYVMKRITIFLWVLFLMLALRVIEIRAAAGEEHTTSRTTQGSLPTPEECEQIREYFKNLLYTKQDFVDWLKARGKPVVDLMEAHEADFADYRVSVDEYLKTFYVGHYGPPGNFFTASAIKDPLVEMLDPKPIPYQND